MMVGWAGGPAAGPALGARPRTTAIVIVVAAMTKQLYKQLLRVGDVGDSQGGHLKCLMYRSTSPPPNPIMTEFLRRVVQFVMQFGFSPTVRHWRSLELPPSVTD